jgi:pyruvate ferredoxin oxidoreductase gamma subunit
MNPMLEIRWHGRGGQGAKTAALLFADAALSSGKYIQAFSEYGPERTGAPVAAYDRLADEPITLHCGVTAPQVVVILDPTLIGKVDVIKGLPQDGSLIVNTDLAPKEMRARLKLTGRKVYTVDASGISKETLGRAMPNTPMLGAVARVTGVMKLEDMLRDNREKLTKKLRNKPELIEGNLKAIERAYKELVAE